MTGRGRSGVGATALIPWSARQAAGRLAVGGDAFGADRLDLGAQDARPQGGGRASCGAASRSRRTRPAAGRKKKLRAGTENTPAIVGFGVAAALRRPATGRGCAAVARLRDRPSAASWSASMQQRSSERGRAAGEHGGRGLAGASGEAPLIRLDLEGVAVVSEAPVRAARSPLARAPRAGLAEEAERRALSLSRETTDAEIARVLDLLPAVVDDVRAVSARAGGRSRAPRSPAVIVECDQAMRSSSTTSRAWRQGGQKLRCSRCRAIFEVVNTRAFEAQAGGAPGSFHPTRRGAGTPRARAASRRARRPRSSRCLRT
jgi:hypothetical protein